MKIVTIEGAWLLHCCTKFQLDIWKFLDILVYAEYSDTDISKFFSRKQLTQWETKIYQKLDIKFKANEDFRKSS